VAESLYNHSHRIKDLQSARVKSLYPGTIVSFKYIGDKVFDKKPMVLVLWNDYTEYKIHGINLNYLTDHKIKLLFREMMEVKENTLTEEDQTEEYDDNLPYRNLLKDPYTRLKLPTYKEERGGNPLSKSEALKQMNILYEKKLKTIVKKNDIYRSYIQSKMSIIKVVTYDIKGLLK
jgi:hypothetical protein|tara:strand:- start:15649 stop:16176 length:528 start_codon:yes stop_codon:yes gene_type:complete